MAIKVGLITTLNKNIGDDLIRDGVCKVLERVFVGDELEYLYINKHHPMTAYPVWNPIRWSLMLPTGRTTAARLLGRIFSRLGKSYFHDCDLIVQCGAPVMWHGCHRCEWAETIWHQIISRLHHKIPVLNLAAGSCYPWAERDSIILADRDRDFLESILGYTRVTTMRDKYARQISASLGYKCELVPCTAFLSCSDDESQDKEDGTILVNYMYGGGHYHLWNKDDNPEKWEATIKSVIQTLSGTSTVKFLCHNQREYDIAGKLCPDIPRLFPRTTDDFFKMVSGTSAAICNRLHATVGLACLGIPSVAIGTDTRMMMVDAIGLPVIPVNNAEPDIITTTLNTLIKNRKEEKKRLHGLKDETMKRYIDLIERQLDLPG